MWRKHSNAIETAFKGTPQEIDSLMKQAARWGLEAGFLGIDGQLEPRIQALLREAAARCFGYCEADRDSLLARLENLEAEWNDEQRTVSEYRARYGLETVVLSGRRWRRLRTWIWDYRDYCAARAVCRRLSPVVRRLREEFDALERKRRAAAEWRETSAQALRATYEFQRARAARLRPEMENGHDARELHQCVLRRAN